MENTESVAKDSKKVDEENNNSNINNKHISYTQHAARCLDEWADSMENTESVAKDSKKVNII
jgi:hypothetical protein